MLTLNKRLQPLGLKVEWAKKHINELQTHVRAFLDSKPYVVGLKANAQNPNAIVPFVVSAQDTPIDFAMIAGDVLVNLRAALDYLAYELVSVNNQSPTPSTYFPIFDSGANYQTNSPRKTCGMSTAAKAKIDAIQPYKGGEGHILWQLNKLNNINKHRALVTVGAAVSRHGIAKSLRAGAVKAYMDAGDTLPLADPVRLKNLIDRMQFRPPDRKCPLKPGDEIPLAFSPTLAPDDEVDISFEIAFGEPEVLASEPIVETLAEMANCVDGVLLDFKNFLS